MADKKTTKKTAVKTENSTKKIADLRGKTEAELHVVLAAAKADLLEAQKSLKANELANPIVVRKMRREIARIKTIIAEKVAETTPARHSKLDLESSNKEVSKADKKLTGSRVKPGMTATDDKKGEK